MLFAEDQDPLAPAAPGVLRQPMPQPTAPDPFAASPPPPAFGSTVGAAFRQQNPIASVLDAVSKQSPDTAYDAHHNPLDLIRGTSYERDNLDKFIDSPNEATTRSIMSKIDSEEHDRQTLASSGTAGVVASIGAGLLDPTFFIPFLGETDAAASVARSAARLALTGGLLSTVSEGALQASQVSRPLGESAGNIASGTLLMGLLGGAGAMLSRAEQKSAAAGLDAVRQDFAPVARFGTADVGAAATDQRQMRLKNYHLPDSVKNAPVVGPVSSWLGDKLNKFSPTLRVFSGGDVALPAKRAMGDLASSALTFEDAAKGIAPTTDGLPPIDALVKAQMREGVLNTGHVLTDAYKDYRYGQNQPFAPMARAAIDDLRGTNTGKLSYSDFKKEVSTALYSDDQHPTPQVQQAAQIIRQRVLDPVKKVAQETLGPDGRPLIGAELDAPAGDKSFFPRMWNKDALASKRNDAQGIFSNWLEGEQATKAAAKDRLTDLQDRHEAIGGQLDKLEGRLDTLDQRTADTGSRLDERAMEAGKADARAGTLEERSGDIKEHLSELEEFIGSMRGELRDPQSLARMDELQKEVASLRQEAAPMSQAELDRLNRSDLAKVLPGDARKAAEMYLGKRRRPKEPSFLSYLRSVGGVGLERGDAANIFGREGLRNGLVRKDGLSFDALGERLANDFPEAFGGRPDTHEVEALLSDAAGGRDPSWFRALAMPERDRALAEMADSFEEVFRDAPTEPKSLREMVDMLQEDGGHAPAALQRLIEKAKAAGDLPGAEGALSGRRQALEELRKLIDRARAEGGSAERAGGVAGAREQEAGIAAGRSRGRLRLLQDRLDRQRTMQDLLEAARTNAEKARQDIRGKMEDEVRTWKGDTTADAMAALKARDEAERVRGLKQQAGVYAGKGARLTGADGPVDRAVKNILASDRNLSKQELDGRANEIVDRILGSPDGRLPYDEASGGPSMGAPGSSQKRGSMNARDFAIPTGLVKDFVHHDTEHVIASFLRTMLPDITLTQRFGDVDMTNVFREINESYAAKAATLTGSKALKALEAERQAMIRDVAATRDRVRGVYGTMSDGMRNAARVANNFRNFNIGADLGTSVFNRLQDATNGVFRYGLMNVFHDGFRPFLLAMTGSPRLLQAQRREAIALKTAVDSAMGHMAHQFGDVMENDLPGSKFARGLGYAADKAMIINGHGPWTDWMKTLSNGTAGAEFLRIAERIAEGKAKGKDIERMAAASITPSMAARIWREFSNGGGEVIDGTRVTNTADWKDMGARQAYAAAMMREAETSVVTPGMEKPLWMSHPIASLLGQFKSFIAGAHERILISNMQQRDGRTLQGLLTMIATGMLSYRLYTWLSGQQASDRPQDWIKEGIQRSAVTGWFGELNAMQAKFTGGKTDAFRMIGADHPLSRYDSRSALAELLGPTYSRLEGMTGAIGDAVGGRWNANDTHKTREWMYLQNLFATRRLFDAAEDGINNAMGLKPRDRSGMVWGPAPPP